MKIKSAKREQIIIVVEETFYMNLSVIIACYNGADFISNQLEALANQRYSGTWEVIISDNGSTDNSLTIVNSYKGLLPGLRIVDSSDKRRRAHARNVGVSAATGDVLLFLDQDDEVDPGYIVAMSEALTEHDFVAGRLETRKLNEPWVQKSRGHPQDEGLIKYQYPRFLPHAAGCTLGIKKTLHTAVGGLDESFFSLDDTDYCWRVQLKGTKLNFVPDAVVHYRYRTKFKNIFRQAFEYSEENVKLYKKYLPMGMPTLSWKDGMLSWKDLIKRLRRIRDKGDLANWIFRLGWRLGRVRGSLKHRIVAF